MTQLVQRALRASLLNREMVLIHSLIDSEDEAAIKAALAVWAYGEQSEFRLPRKLPDSGSWHRDCCCFETGDLSGPV
jgi:hypothetical protein